MLKKLLVLPLALLGGCAVYVPRRPVAYVPPPVVVYPVRPRPIFVAPRPMIVAPRPVIVAPRPVVVAPPRRW